MDHVLRSIPGNVQWGLWDGRLKPVLRIASGDRVTIETLSGEPDDLPDPSLGFDIVPGHEAPAPGIVELGKMPEEAAEGQPSIGLHQLDRSAPAQQMHGARTSLECHRCVIEGRGARANHRDALAA